MNVFEQHILETIDFYNMIKKGQTVVAAVSGGYDSLCMLNVLVKLRKLRGFDVCAVHINHMFRCEANSDEQFVVDEAKRLGIKAYTKRIDVSKYASDNKMSFETAGRKLRYEFFNEICKKYENPVIATAHNANDSAESMIMHLMRGSGITGLLGIRPVSENIIRPLIRTNREEIENYCNTNNLIPRHDVTNDCDDYKRNDIRHNVLKPMLERCSLASISNTMEILSEDDDFIENFSFDAYKNIVKISGDKKYIPVKEFNKFHKAVRRRIIKTAISNSDENNQICLVHIDEIIAMAEKNYGGKNIKLPGKRTVRIEKGDLII